MTEHIQVQPGSPLTKRERDVLELMAEGAPNEEIAEVLGIGLATVRTYIKRIFNRFGARNRTHAVALAYQFGHLREGRAIREAA